MFSAWLLMAVKWPPSETAMASAFCQVAGESVSRYEWPLNLKIFRDKWLNAGSMSSLKLTVKLVMMLVEIVLSAGRRGCTWLVEGAPYTGAPFSWE